MTLHADAMDMIERGALVVVNHSGGKDSQAMMIALSAIVPADQLLVVHAHLPGVEWAGTWEHVQTSAAVHGVQAIQVQAGKTLLGMVEKRGMWPSATTRQCTSDLKRGPIEKAIRHHLKANPQFGGMVISAMGLRAEESPARSKQSPWKFDRMNSKAGRQWFRWLPILGWTRDQVFTAIRTAGQEPHWAYGAGMTRLSCCFCIMASRADLCTAARLQPGLYRQYADLEKRIGHTLAMDGRGIEEVTGIPADLLVAA